MFQYALNNYNYEYYTQKMISFKTKKTIFCNDDAVPNRPHPLSKAKKAKQPLP